MNPPVKSPIHVLCVDDEIEILEIMADCVSAAGFIPMIATSVDEAIKLIHKYQGSLSLVLSDFAMGKKTGFDLRKEMLADFKHIPFVLVSGHISRDTALTAVELKISAFVEKPYAAKDLTEVIRFQSKDRVESIREDEELREGFVDDANNLIEEMERLLLSLEADPGNVDLLDRIFACAHTIKGSSGFFKPNTIHQFMHKFEDYLAPFKKGQKILGRDASQVLLNGLDKLKYLVELLKNQTPGEVDVAELIKIFTEATVEIHAASEAPGIAQAKTPAPVATENAKPAEELKISLAVLNEFMEKSGDITVLRSMVNKVFRTLELTHSDDPNMPMLSDLMSELHKSISGMQDQVADLRKVSAAQITRPLQRTMRDLSVSLKKNIHFEVTGDSLRIDHGLSEVLGKCLIHMLRNSADHGIEIREKRAQTNKPAQGKIFLSFAEVGHEIIVRMGDDGQGIDAQRIKAKAIEKGIITEQAAALKSDSEIRMLLFEPGFSTAESITDVSGRGVGTDMVKQAILRAGGTIQVNSTVGLGSEFILTLPVPKSVLIVNAFLVRSGDNVYAIPQENVDRIQDLAHPETLQNISNLGDIEVYKYNGKMEPLFRLTEIFRLPQARGEPRKGFIMRIHGVGGSFCLQVDDVISNEDVVVKSLGPWFRELQIYKGATFLGDGRIGLVLDIDGICRANLSATVEVPKAASSEARPDENREEYLLFNLGDAATFAFGRASVYRLERLGREQIQSTGHDQVFIYRDRVMPLVDLRTKDLGTSDLDVIIIQRANSAKTGYIVSQIEDLSVPVNLGEPSFYSEGHPVHIIENRTVTLLNIDHLRAA